MNDPRRQCDESDDRKKEREKADGHHQVDGALPREESRNRRLGGIDDVVHYGITLRDARRAMKSVYNRRTEVLRHGVVFGAATTCTCCLRGPGCRSEAAGAHSLSFLPARTLAAELIRQGSIGAQRNQLLLCLGSVL